MPLCFFSDLFSIHPLFNDLNLHESRVKKILGSSSRDAWIGQLSNWATVNPQLGSDQRIWSQSGWKIIVIRVHAQKAVINR